MASNATPVSTASTTNSCCKWFEDKLSDKSRMALKITGFVVSFLLLTVAVIATLVSTGVLTETFPLYSMGKIGQLASGILLTLSVASTVVFGILLGRVIQERFCKKAEQKEELIVEEKTNTSEVEQQEEKKEQKKGGWC